MIERRQQKPVRSFFLHHCERKRTAHWLARAIMVMVCTGLNAASFIILGKLKWLPFFTKYRFPPLNFHVD